MTLKPRRPHRSARVETKVSPATYEAVEAFAVANGCSLSSAVCRMVLEWERGKKGPPLRTRTGARCARLDAKLEPRLREALKAWAEEHGVTVSSALNAIIVASIRAERRRVRRRAGGLA